MIPFQPHSFGPYFLIRSIGKGGMAEVFLAAPTAPDVSAALPPLVALKRIRPEFSRHKVFSRRFVDEAKISALLRQPNIVEVFELGVVGTELYFSMEWVEGKSLDAVLAKLRERGETFPGPLADYISLQLVQALDYARQLKDGSGRDLHIVHRDVTPGNVLIRYDGSVKLSDFGLATAERSIAAETGEVAIGRLPYMSPEQIRAERVDHRADLYSLAVLIHELRTGSRPFRADRQLELQRQILNEAPAIEFGSETAKPVRDQLVRCLEKNRDQRPDSVAELFPLFRNVPADARSKLSALLSTLFVPEVEREREETRLGLTAWSEMKLLGTDLNSEAFEGDSLPSLAEKTEFLPASEASERTRIVFTRGTQGAPPDLSEVSFVKDLLSEASDQPVEITAPPVPIVERRNPGAKKVAKIGVIRKQVERLVERPAPVEEAYATAPRQESEEILRLATESSGPKPDSAPPPVVHEQHTSSISPYPELRPLKRRSWKPYVPHLTAGAVCLVALLSWVLWKPHSEKRKPVPVAMREWKISLFVSAESKSADADQRSLAGWSTPPLRNRMWMRPLGDFFEREYQRWTGRSGVNVSFGVFDPQKEISSLEWRSSLFHPGRPFSDLKRLFGVVDEGSKAGKGALFVHLYAKNFWEAPRYPVDLRDKRPERMGLVFVPLSPKEDEESLVRIAHEALHILGASDKYDGSGQPVFPNGFAEPRKAPRYPQVWGEIMSRALPLAENNHRPLKSLRESAIGDRTAEEIGWSNP